MDTARPIAFKAILPSLTHWLASPKAPLHSRPATTMSSDSLALLAQRLQALSEDGIKVNPATAHPGEWPAEGRGSPFLGLCQ